MRVSPKRGLSKTFVSRKPINKLASRLFRTVSKIFAASRASKYFYIARFSRFYELSRAGRIRHTWEDGPSEVWRGEDPLQPGRQIGHFFEPRQILEVGDAVVNPVSGTVWLDRKGVAESSPWNPEKVFARSPFLPGRFFRASYDRYLLVGQRQWNYYHFLVEELPKVLRVKAKGIDFTVIVAADAPNYVVDWLGRVEAPVRRITRSVTVGRLLLPVVGNDTGWPHPRDVELLRQEVGIPKIRSSERNKLYVSRRRSKRPLENELDVESWFRTRGFQIVLAESLSIENQIELFSAASVVVGPHGAGLVNLVFCEPGTKVLELVSPSNSNACFAVLAELNQLDYECLTLDDRGRKSSGVVDFSKLEERVLAFG